MSKHDRAARDKEDRMSPELYRELAKDGWRLPQSEPEVKAAETWVAKSSDRLPERLDTTPGEVRPQEPGRLLDHYVRADRLDRSGGESKSMDDNRSNRDIERE